ncbi:MAG TPA: hypothetical protein VK604_20125 [Bryobacteraceae bacterium]|nr:hypothetical protein [Bryobacteraceae bacterium]
MSKESQIESQQISVDQIPLYVRWTPERYPYALEMRLDLVARVTADLAQAESLGIEIGGMLIGELPARESPVLRVDDMTIVARRVEDGPIYMLDPEQAFQLTEIKQTARLQNRQPVGFFRSHLRPGPLLPSIADKTLLAEQFPRGDYALLLVQSQEPRTAGFFLAVEGQLPDQPSVRKFFFDATEFKRLPEVPVEQVLPPKPIAVAAESKQRGHRWIAGLSMAALLVLGALIVFSGAITRYFRPESNKLNLVAVSKANVLQITWDHNAPFVLNAKSALLTIDDGSSHREMILAPDELKVGEVDYERQGAKVSVVVTLNSPGSNLPPQTLIWSQN